MILPRGPFSDAPPEPRSRMENWPTVLYSWWCTSFATAFILTRLSGRKTRSDRLFREDYIMMLSLIPLWIRMVLVHFVLIYGTNNVATVGHEYTSVQLDHRSIGSRMVLASRIFYAAFIWLCKWTVSEFLKRITLAIWRPSYEWVLRGIRLFLILTFIAVIIATLAGCEPFDHFWQVVPDPGPQCRQGFNQLLTMGICDIVTDLALVAFPIPIILQSGQSLGTKLKMGALFSLSLIMVAVTATRMPSVIIHHGRQQYRSVWASSEILAAAATCNMIIIGTFLRDKGTKKNKYRAQSVSDSVDRISSRRPTAASIPRRQSDEDLFRTMGFAIPAHLQDPEDHSARPAPPAMPPPPSARRFSRAETLVGRNDTRGSESDDSVLKPHTQHSDPSPVPSSSRSVTLFDPGYRMDGSDRATTSHSRSTTINGDAGIYTQDFAPPSPQESRRGSRNLHTDLTAFSAAATNRNDARNFSTPTRRQVDTTSAYTHSRRAPTGVLGPMLERHETQQSLQDAGGLLNAPVENIELSTRRAPLISAFRGSRGVHYNRPRGLSFEDVGGLLTGSQRNGTVETSTPQTRGRRQSHSGRGRPENVSSQGTSADADDLVLYDAGGLAH